jgi:hypothetical protein
MTSEKEFVEQVNDASIPRRDVLMRGGALTVAGVAASVGPSALAVLGTTAIAETKPNIVFILVDDLG